MSTRPVFPFTAIVGQDSMRLALLLHAVDPRLGGVLIRGEKGTAKSTAVRALANLLPSTRAVEGCLYGCDPADRGNACERCAGKLESGTAPETVDRPVPVVELPIGATEDRLIGSLDLERAIQSGERHFEPGLLARANRGILYVDEVNLLGDHLVDVVLDAAAMGRNYVEREGVSFSHPASFMMIGTMNPEEGDLRPQLLDRFALVVQVTSLTDPALRAEVVRRRIAFERDAEAFIGAQAAAESEERQRLSQARARLPFVHVPEAMLDLIVRICSAFEVDGMRGDLAIYHTSAALAAYRGRDVVTVEDVRAAAELALPHRRRRQPFEETGLDTNRLNDLMNNERESEGESPSSSADTSESGQQPNGDGASGESEEQPVEGGRVSPAPGQANQPASQRISPPGKPLQASLPSPARSGHSTNMARGRRAGNEQPRGGAMSSTGRATADRFELALAATLRAAAPYQVERRSLGTGPAVRLVHGDLRERIRRGRTAELVLFLVDASGSMGARARMAAAKSAVLGLLLDAYRRRDRVGLVAFRGDRAELLLPFTNSVELAERCLRYLPAGGRTPLAGALELGRKTLQRALEEPKPFAPLLVVVSDGHANLGLGGIDAWPAALDQAQRIRALGWSVLFVDPEAGRGRTGLGHALASTLGAELLPLDRLRNREDLA